MRSDKQANRFAPITADIASLKEQLGVIATTLATLVAAVKESERGSFTQDEFRKRHKLSESQYFKLKREGRGPRTMSTGNVGQRISRDAEREWIAAREAETDAEVQAPSDF